MLKKRVSFLPRISKTNPIKNVPIIAPGSEAKIRNPDTYPI